MTTPDQKTQLSAWFSSLQERICAALESLEEEALQLDLPPKYLAAGRFSREIWKRQGSPLVPSRWWRGNYGAYEGARF